MPRGARRGMNPNSCWAIGILVFFSTIVNGGLDKSALGSFPSIAPTGLRVVLRPTLCLRGGLPGAKKATDEDWSQESEEYDDDNNAQINQAWEQYLDEQRLRDPPEGSDGSEAEDDPWEEGGIRERAGGQRADDGETQIRDRTLNGDREIKGQDGKQSNGEESDEAEGSSDSNKYLDESADSDGLHHKSKFDEVHQSSTTKEEFKVSIDMLRRWHEEMKNQQLDQMKSNLLQGDTQAALQSIHKANIRSRDFNMTNLLEFGFKCLNDSHPRGSGLIGLSPEEEKRLVYDEQLTSQDLYKMYSGWDPMEIMEDFRHLEAKMNTIRVPAEIEDLKSAVFLSLEMGRRLLVSPGDYQWKDRLIIESSSADTKLKLFGGDCVIEDLKQFEVGGSIGAHTRLWGQWALHSGTWGTMYNASFVHELETRGGAALFIIVGGTTAFPWSFYGVQARCSGGISILQAQTSFTSIIGSIVGGASSDLNETATYGMVLMEQAHSILQASTLGYAEISGIRLLGDGVAVLDKCIVSGCKFGFKLSDRCKTLVRNSTFVDNNVSAFYVEDELEQEIQVPTSLVQMVVAYSNVIPNSSLPAETKRSLPSRMIQRVWHQRALPGTLLEKGNNFLPLANITEDQVDPFANKSIDLFRSEILFKDQEEPEQAAKKPFAPVQHDHLLVPVPEDKAAADAYRRLQKFIDRNGCRKILARANEINSRNLTSPFVFMTNSTGFVVVNSQTREEVAAWDKIEAGRPYEVLISCPSCHVRSRVRSGLTGKLRCNKCRAVFPREKTAAGVTCVGIDPKVDKCMRENVVGDSIQEVDATTHAILPLPGNKFAVVKRPEKIDVEKEKTSNKTSLAAQLQEIKKKASDAHQNKSTTSPWMENMAKLLEKGKVEWNLETREMMFNSKNEEKEKEEEKAKEPEQTREEVEGPELERKEEETGPRLTLMTGNTTGNPIVDRVLKDQGVIMTGDDRPFGIRSPTDVRQEVEESRDGELAARQVKDAYTTQDVEEGNEQEHAAGKGASASWDAVKEGKDDLEWSDSQQDSSQVQKDIERAYLQYKQQHPVNPQLIKEMRQYRQNLSDIQNYTFDFNFTGGEKFRDNAQVLSAAFEMWKKKSKGRGKAEQDIVLGDNELQGEDKEDEEDEEYSADEEGVRGLEPSLLKSFRRQMETAENFFQSVVGRKFDNPEEQQSTGQELRSHFIELGKMKTELHEPDEPWPEELREQVHDLKLKLKQLMSEIWIYCESGGFERGEPVDVPAMMKTLRTMGLMDR